MFVYLFSSPGKHATKPFSTWLTPMKRISMYIFHQRDAFDSFHSPVYRSFWRSNSLNNQLTKANPNKTRFFHLFFSFWNEQLLWTLMYLDFWTKTNFKPKYHTHTAQNADGPASRIDSDRLVQTNESKCKHFRSINIYMDISTVTENTRPAKYLW